MFESANLDRFLRAAQTFLGKEDFDNAIKVLQEVIEGRTGEFMLDPENEGEAAGNKKAANGEPKTSVPRGKTKKVKKPEDTSQPLIDEENPAYSVYSSDDRIYRPVARLCHELLASMPAEGIGLYRARYEAQAKKAYETSLRNADLSGLESVYNHHFVTLSAARAMASAADLLMDSGRFRAAIQTLQTLLEVYPADSRKEAGIRDLMLMTKVAVCYQQLGELEMARDHLTLATQNFPEASVRLMGELYTVKDMHESDLFDVKSLVAPVVRTRATTLDLVTARALTPMWEFRFSVPNPYKAKTSSKTRTNAIRFGGRSRPRVHGTLYPKVRKYMPGTTVAFEGHKMHFLDHFRPVVHDLTSGRQRLAMGGPKLLEYRRSAKTLTPGSRIPTYDYFAGRVVSCADRHYVIEGYNSTSSDVLQGDPRQHAARLRQAHRSRGLVPREQGEWQTPDHLPRDADHLPRPRVGAVPRRGDLRRDVPAVRHGRRALQDLSPLRRYPVRARTDATDRRRVGHRLRADECRRARRDRRQLRRAAVGL